MARKSKDDEKQSSGSPAWMTTYADMVTLLLAFFVFLYSLSTIDVERFQTIISAFQDSLGILPGGRGHVEEPHIDIGSPEVGVTDLKEEEAELQNIADSVQEFIQERELQGRVQLKIDERGLVIHLLEGGFFDPGRAQLKEDAIILLNDLVEKLYNVEQQIRVEGHTDDVPTNPAVHPTNWELSAARATTVVRFLIEQHGFSPYQLSAGFYSEYRPIAPNTTPENKALNRRVDLVILRDSYSKVEAQL